MRWTIPVTMVMLMTVSAAAAADSTGDRAIRQIVTRAIQPMLSDDDVGGVAVAVRIAGRTLFFNYGYADSSKMRPMTSDSLFNLASVRKPFEADLLAQAAENGELRLDDPVADYVTELQDGADIRQVTLGQLATHTSGLLLPQDHPPWPTERYTLAQFIGVLKAWKEDKEQAPGKQHIYSHAGYILLQLALERRFHKPIAQLLQERVISPLGLASTLVPMRGTDDRAEMAGEFMARAVQGYNAADEPVGLPGNQQTYYDFPGTGQMFSSARDLAVYAAAHLGELPLDRALAEAMRLAEQPRFSMSPRNAQALAWEVNTKFAPTIVEKNGGMTNSTTYVGLMRGAKLAVVVLCNRGDQDGPRAGRLILSRLVKLGNAARAASPKRHS